MTTCPAPLTPLPWRRGTTAITFGTAPAASHAYYTLTGSAVDRAGNFATPVMPHVRVRCQCRGHDANATAPAAPGSLEPGESFEIASFLNDDLSIREYYVTADFGTDIRRQHHRAD